MSKRIMFNRIPYKIRKIYQKTSRKLLKLIMSIMMRKQQSARFSRAGFVLPTVTMVLLVVALMTFAITLRSFQRSETARYLKVDLASLGAGAPALERGLAKINRAFTEVEATPSDISLLNKLGPDEADFNETSEYEEAVERYDLPDESRLVMAYDVKTIIGDPDQLNNRKTTTTAWKYPIDTDNNGKYDSFALYGIFLRSPSQDPDTNNFNRVRNSLEARTPPIPKVELEKPSCPQSLTTSASLVGTADWYKIGANLMKSFFVYSVTVPITELPDNATNYEIKEGDKTFTGLELQHDRSRVPLANHAIVYEDDLQMTPGSGIRLNGRVFTNGNLLTGTRPQKDQVEYYLVSSPDSCFYEMENSKIVVGGNTGIGSPESDDELNPVRVDLFDLNGNLGNVEMGPDEKSVDSTPDLIAYNDQRYVERINSLVSNWIAANPQTANTDDPVPNDPEEVKLQVTADATDIIAKQRNQALERYFKNRTRRVPFADTSDDELTTDGSGDPPDPLRAKDKKAIYPYDLDDASDENNGLALNFNGNDKLQPPATDPEIVAETQTEEKLGDRVVVGGGLPAATYNEDSDDFGIESIKLNNAGTAIVWDNEDPGNRTQVPRIEQISDIDPGRDGFWELSAAAQPKNQFAGTGGLRMVTGAGVYERKNSFLPPPEPSQINGFDVVWPDSMPMSPLGVSSPDTVSAATEVYDNDGGSWTALSTGTLPATTQTPTIDPSTRQYAKGDLRMRATAVYLYNQDTGNNEGEYQAPQACVSSYYDPTNSITAQNIASLPWAAGTNGKSNNGIVYGPPTTTAETFTPSAYTGGLFTGSENSTTLAEQVSYQANLVFPSGRFVNETLRSGLIAKSKGEDLSLSQQAAIDSTICAIEIAKGSLTADTTLIDHGTIKEMAFLDQRQIKAIENQAIIEGNDNYDLPIEDRQPLEIRVTQIDLSKMRTKPVGSMSMANPPKSVPNEYLLPNSGIIYATRDDALLDLSDNSLDTEERKRKSPSDFLLDPTRRPNGIMLINGSVLARSNNNEYKDEEKGLILATNLPTYIQADNYGFNLHQNSSDGDGNTIIEEFTERLSDNANWDRAFFYKRSTLDDQFACRANDPRLPDCTTGDFWRTATIISDAVTLLSHDFRPGFRVEGDYDLRNNTDITGNEVIIKQDATTAAVRSSDVVIGYDVNNDNSGIPEAADQVDETLFNLDLNGDGDIADTDVPETEITATMAYKLKRLKNGFYDNNFVTSYEWFKNDGYPEDFDISEFTNTGGTTVPYFEGSNTDSIYSSYFSNFISPVQRRQKFPVYLMEMCMKLPVSECGLDDWVVDAAGTKASDVIGNGYDITTHLAGTTAEPAYDSDPADSDPEYRRYPRRIAFRRNASDELLDDSGTPLTSGNNPVPLGIDTGNNIVEVSYSGYPGNIQTSTNSTALWFRTTDKTAPYGTTWRYNANPLYLADELVTGDRVQTTFGDLTTQPLLVPVLQFHTPTGKPGSNLNVKGTATDKNWMQRATGSTFNAILAGGDVPIRSSVPGVTKGAEPNGGAPNFTRYMEIWRQGKNKVDATISGSLIQFKRSAYATAPFTPVLSQDKNYQNELSRFGYEFNGKPKPYRVSNADGQQPQYMPPTRVYGFDVAILSQTPDLFASTFTINPTVAPSEYFREVAKDDPWIETLLCATEEDTEEYALPEDQRPDECFKP